MKKLSLYSRLKEGVKRNSALVLAATLSLSPVAAYGQSAPQSSPVQSSSLESRAQNPQNPSPAMTNPVYISGVLQDNETNQGHQGAIRLYNAKDNTFLENTVADENGNFRIAYDNKSKISEFFVSAVLTLDNGVSESYIRTIKVPAKNTSNLAIKAVSYPEFDFNNDGIITNQEKQDSITSFRKYAEEINPYFYKWNLDDLQNKGGFEILDRNATKGGSGAEFTKEQQDFIEQQILNPQNIGIYTQGRTIKVQEDNSSTPASERHYKINSDGSYDEDKNWIIIVPMPISWDVAAIGGMDFDVTGSNRGYLFIRIDHANEGNSGLLAHEFGHVFIAPYGHTQTLSEPFTIIAPNFFTLKLPGPADKKMATIAGQSAYSGNFTTPAEWNNILGISYPDGKLPDTEFK